MLESCCCIQMNDVLTEERTPDLGQEVQLWQGSDQRLQHSETSSWRVQTVHHPILRLYWTQEILAVEEEQVELQIMLIISSNLQLGV